MNEERYKGSVVRRKTSSKEGVPETETWWRQTCWKKCRDVLSDLESCLQGWNLSEKDWWKEFHTQKVRDA